MGLTNAERQKRYRGRKNVTVEGENVTECSESVTGRVTVWEAGGYRGEWIDGVFCVNGKPYRIGDILDLQHASYQMIANLYAM